MKRITLALPAPYVGLRPFTEAEALLFFGRDAHVRDLLARMERRQRFLAVLGASGSGKSSLVRAGLIPALHRGALYAPAAPADTAPGSAAAGIDIPRWNICTFTPGDAPLSSLAQALAQDPRWVDNTDPVDARAALSAALGNGPRSLADLYSRKAALFTGEALLLVVDQFEEIFRYRQRNPDEADRFVQLMLRSAGVELPIYVVITMRSDFLGQAVAVHGLAEAINSGIYLTPRLDADQIRSVIVAPLSLVGGEIDPVLATRLLNTLAGDDELPVLQHALLRMWDRARRAGRTTIETDDFLRVCAPRERAGAGAGEPALAYAIDNHASEIFEALTPQQQRAARQFFLALAERRDGRDVRRPQTLRELQALFGADLHDALAAVVDAYRAQGVGFVLPAAPAAIGADDLIDISHESLIRRWQRFQAWLGEEDLDVAELKEWLQRAHRQADGGGWLDDKDGERALHWRARVNQRCNAPVWANRYFGPGAHELVDGYIQGSLDQLNRKKAEDEALRREAEEARVRRFEIEAQMQREATDRAEADKARAEHDTAQALAMAAVNRRRSRIATAGAVASLIFAFAAALFWWQSQKALQRAEGLARTARAGELATLAESLSKDYPDQSVLLALEASSIERSPRAVAIIRAAPAAYPYRKVLRGHEGLLYEAQFSADGKTALTASSDHTARLWDVDSGQQIRVLKGHEGKVYSARFSPDGKTVLTASTDQTARLWDVATGRQLRELRGHEQIVTSAQFSYDGRTVLTAGYDSTARLWDVASGQELRKFQGHSDIVTSAQFSDDAKMMLTVSRDNTVRLWDVASGKGLRALRGHQDIITDARFSADGRSVLTASFDNTARLWDVASGKELRTLLGHENVVTRARFSPDGKTLLTASWDATVRLWDLASGKEVRTLHGHEGKVYDAKFTADGKNILTASRDKTARIWDTASGQELRALRGHEEVVFGAQLSADGKTVLTASWDKTARIWDLTSGKELYVIGGQKSEFRSTQLSADGKTVLIAVNDRVARLWDVASGNQLLALSGHEDVVRSAKFSPDGKTVLTASQDRTARLWDVVGGKELRTLSGHTGPVVSAEFSADGKMALTASEDGTARLWNVQSGEILHTLDRHTASVRSAQFSADARTVLTASEDKTARLWDAATGMALHTLSGHQQAVTSALFSPDGKSVLTASADKTARLWDVFTGEIVHELAGHQGAVTTALFSADGKTLVTASFDDDTGFDNTAWLWDVASGKMLHTLRGHEDKVYSAEFSADGRTVLTASQDKTARLWDAATGKELRVLRGHQDPVYSARFSADGKMVVTASGNSNARLWRCDECRPYDETAREVAQRVGRSLTDDERSRFGLTPAHDPPKSQ